MNVDQFPTKSVSQDEEEVSVKKRDGADSDLSYTLRKVRCCCICVWRHDGSYSLLPCMTASHG